MTTEKKAVDRRSFMKGALASVAVIPFSGALAACAGSSSDSANDTNEGGKVSESNPFGMADKSSVDAVIFDGGYGIDYVEFAAKLMEKNHAGSTVKVSPSTKIAQELQPRFVGGNPPDLIDNSGADAIGFSTILDQLEDLIGRPRREEPRGDDDPRHPVRWRRGAGHVRRQAGRAQLRDDGLRDLVLGEPVRGERLDPAEDVGRGDRPGRQGQGEGQVPVRVGQGGGDLLPDPGDRVGDQGRRRRGPARAGEPQGGLLVAPGGPGRLQRAWTRSSRPATSSRAESGTQFTAAQAQWSNDQDALLYPSGSWIENEMKDHDQARLQDDRDPRDDGDGGLVDAVRGAAQRGR